MKAMLKHFLRFKKTEEIIAVFLFTFISLWIFQGCALKPKYYSDLRIPDLFRNKCILEIQFIDENISTLYKSEKTKNSIADAIRDDIRANLFPYLSSPDYELKIIVTIESLKHSAKWWGYLWSPFCLIGAPVGKCNTEAMISLKIEYNDGYIIDEYVSYKQISGWMAYYYGYKYYAPNASREVIKIAMEDLKQQLNVRKLAIEENIEQHQKTLAESQKQLAPDETDTSERPTSKVIESSNITSIDNSHKVISVPLPTIAKNHSDNSIENQGTWVTACNAGTRLLSTPGGNTPIARIPAGTRLLVLERKNVQMGMVNAPWYKVKYGNKTGWVSSFSTKEGENGPVNILENNSHTEPGYPINFEILQDSRKSGGATLEILVSKRENKDDIMKLAQMIFEENSSKGSLILNIFDSYEAYLNRDNPNYPEEEYWKHFLVQGINNPSNGYQNLEWVAENRDH